MVIYFVIAAFLWAAALVETFGKPGTRYLLIAGVVVLCILSGLRFETGYDWTVYDEYLEEAPTLWVYLFTPAAVHEPSIPMEPLYYALNIAVKSVGGGLQLLMAVVAVFNFVILYRFLRRHSSPLTVLAAFYGWIFFSLHMAAIRQSIAVSFCLLAIMELNPYPKTLAAPRKIRGRFWRYVALIVVGVGFQFSAIIFLPLYFVFTKRPSKAVVYCSFGALLAVYFAGFSFVPLILDGLRLVTPAGLSEKIEFYNENLVPARSLGAMAYAVLNVAVFGIGLTSLRDRIPDTEEHNALLNLSLLFCVLHLLTAEVPVLWQRVQYVAFAGQMALMGTALRNSRLRSRLSFWGAAAVASIAFMVFQLSAELAKPYIPYQSYAVYLLTGIRGDGRDRVDEYYQGLRTMYDN
jgi:hypothetical protein